MKEPNQNVLKFDYVMAEKILPLVKRVPKGQVQMYVAVRPDTDKPNETFGTYTATHDYGANDKDLMGRTEALMTKVRECMVQNPEAEWGIFFRSPNGGTLRTEDGGLARFNSREIEVPYVV